jgi:hypothetical protein
MRPKGEYLVASSLIDVNWTDAIGGRSAQRRLGIRDVLIPL